MSLGISYSIVQSRDGKILTFTDTTGNYSVNNVTGYGTPNPDLSEVLRTELRVRNPNTVTDELIVYSTGNFIPKNLLVVNLSSNDLNVGDNVVYPDGVSYWTYSVFFRTGTALFTKDSNQVVVSGVNASNIYDFYTSFSVQGKTYISVNGHLLMVTSMTSSGSYILYLEKPWEYATTTTTFYLGFSENRYLLTYWTSKKYVIDLIADIESTSCCTSCGSEEAWKSYCDLQSALALYSCTKYNQCQEVLNFIVKKTVNSSCSSC